ncbi:MAG: M28 family peptidase [Chloroflexi bacterium]|nr:M28 family peptidase [Chloroflexota bacterium]
MQKHNRTWLLILMAAATLGLLLFVVYLYTGYTRTGQSAASPTFDSQRAYQDVQYQTGLGPRTPGSQAHADAAAWIQTQLEDNGWTVDVQDTQAMGLPIHNITGKRGSGSPWIILGAHYDTRFVASEDPDPALRDQPIDGANDGASGVAVLLELARVIPQDLDKQVWLAFFDTEDQGSIEGWDWILGSRAYAEALTGQPDAVIVLDMIGDADLNIYMERNSDPELMGQIWDQAAALGYQSNFIPEYKYQMLDDHLPFAQKGIPALDVIDFDYPYWHTMADTADKVSPHSLDAVGETVLSWLLTKP